ncbi:Hypothetical protein PENO1_014080 [Penicillium occitanis (nom. inval.)]|nr:Hypothetical protein PENO1_014080 [Penicillium occitanis (nom. inval.)]PCH08324.1 hypothetical protein PENOC_015340 [Penicillium occitanis (nom. inval.)]
MAAIVSLPLEILQAIASELWLSDLSALIRTHRRLYLLLTHSLYQYNKEHHNGSALAWGVRHGMIKTAQYAIQQNCDLGAIYEPGWEYREDLPYDYSYDPCSGLKLLNVAIHRVDYAMTRLLVESGTEVHDTDINLASCGSCQAMIWNLTPSHGSSYGQTPDPGPDDPRSIALRAAIQMGHDELVDLISEKDQTDIPSLFSPIWPSLVETVRSCEARVSIIRLLLEKVAGQQNRRYPLSRYDEGGCCDVTLKLFWEKEKSLTRHKHSIDPGAAAFRGNKPLLGTLIEMGANLNYIDRHKRTPIMWAAYSGRFDIVKLLIERGPMHS